MRLAKLTIASLVFIFLVLTFGTGATPEENRWRQDLIFSYSLDSSRLTLHEPVLLTFTLKNDSRTEVRLNLGSNDVQNFQITIVPPQGGPVRYLRLSPEGLATVGLHRVPPGQEYRRRLILNQWFSFDRIGMYGVEIQLLHPIEMTDGTPVLEPPAFRTHVEILPRDIARLDQVCGTLARQVEDATSYGAALEAALPLGYVEDPAAIPYLQRTLNAGRLVEAPAIDALRRIGSPEAVHVLISALNERQEPNSNTPEMIKAALEIIAHETHDSALRAHIRLALQRANREDTP